MNQKLGKIFPILIVFALFFSGCEFSASTANIQEVQLAKDSDGTEPATTFDPTDTVYAIVALANAPEGTGLKSVWSVVDVGDVAPAGQLIDEVELEAGSGTHFFNLSPSSPFPAGSYKVEIYLDGELAETREFQVSGTVAETPAEPVEAEPVEAEPVEAGVEAPAAGLVDNLEDVQSATIRILSQGSFVDPDFGMQLNSAGQGSGFVIDPSGVAVTNNHVVTGAAFLQVWMEGDTEPRNARVLGVSECSDLAVIDIDGEGYPYLDWKEGDLKVGQEVYAAGFPLFGNEEYTLTKGIISKAAANGESNWASVDHVLETDAAILGGNSGGPLVDGQGQLIGVNYAGNDATRQNFSISRDTAVGVIEKLRQGEDVNAIGINGQAIVSDDGSIAGIWISSVASGSPADGAGILAGDILTKLEGLVLGTDGTMADYCDILRSHDPDDIMGIEVLRLATGELLAGQLNGNPLETAATINLGEDVAAGDSYEDYMEITDDTGALKVEVPTAWSDIDGGSWVVEDTELGPSVMAAPDLDAYLTTWNAPGMFFGATDENELATDKMGVLDAFDYSEDCTYDGRVDYDDGLYIGAYDIWSDCGGTGNIFVVLSATPEDERYLVMVQTMVTSTADEEALDRILETFIVSE